jgi:tetratricopeptide (TPR) repeat protein
VLAASLAILTLVAGIIGTTLGMVRAIDAEAEAVSQTKQKEDALRDKEAALADAEAAEKQARASEADYLAFSRFLVEDVLWAPRPHRDQGGQGIEVTVKQALLQAAGRMSQRFAGQPRAEAVARHDLGVTFRLLGEFAAAEEQLRKALELRRQFLPAADTATLNTQNSLAVVLVERGKAKEAIPLYEDTLKWRKVKLGPNHAHTLTTMDNLANAYRADGRLADALPLFEETLARMTEALSANHPELLTAMNNIAVAYGEAGKRKEKASMLEKAAKGSEAVFGADSPMTLTAKNNLALAYWDLTQADRAVDLMEEVVERRITVIGSEHQHTLTSLNSLGFMYTRFIVGPDFKPCYVTRLPALRKRLPADSPVWLTVATFTANKLLDGTDYAAAEPLLRECLEVGEAKQPRVWRTFHMKFRLGEALVGQKKYADAEPLLLAGYEGLKRCEADIPPPKRVRLTQAVERLVEFYGRCGKTDEADAWRKRLEAQKQKEAGAPSPPR